MTIENGVFDAEWTMDTGASTHMTSNVGILSNLRPYLGKGHVLVGIEYTLSMTNTGDASL